MAMPALAPPTAPTSGCRLVAVDGRPLPLRSVDVTAEAGGGLCRVRLRQTFANPYDEPLAATYLLPLPADGAVVDFAFVLDGRRIAGRVERREDARASFERAVLEGRTAALLEQDRSSVFTQELGNLPPRAEIYVEVDVEQPLRWVDGGWEWRWPTVVGPRYLGAPWQTPDAARITVDVADGPLPVVCRASVAVADAITGLPSSPSHDLVSDGDGLSVTGDLDRDVVVRWPVAAPEPGVRLETARPDGDDEAYALLTLVPPSAPAAAVPRDLCLLLDVSGSMSGAPLAQLKAFSTALIEGLGDGDRLEMIAFASSPMRWRTQPVPIDARSRAEALRWVASLRAGGGTAMHEAVTEALRPLRPDAERQVILMTDGYIGFEQQVIGQIRRGLPPCSRIHAVGVGSAINRTLTGGVARAGGGHEAIVGPDEEVGGAVAALLARTGDPQWIDVSVTGTAVREVAPAVTGDLLAGAPSRISVRVDPRGGTLVLTARCATGVERREIVLEPVAPGTGRRVVATRFARERVEDLETGLAGGEPAQDVDAAIEALGLRHRIATRRTSWVAATDEATVDPADPTRHQRIPHQLPYGVSAEGVGLRAAPSAPMPAAPGAPPAGSRRRAMAVPEKAKKAESSALRPLDPARAARHPAPAPPSLADVFERDEGYAAPEPAPAEVERPGVRRLCARVVALGDGRLVLEVILDEDTDWQPDPVAVVAADGRRTETRPVAGTTRAGRIGAGLRVRLVIAWTGAPPATVEVRDLQLVVER